MIDLLERCVRIGSLSGQEQGVAAFLRDEMDARGFSAYIDVAGNAVGMIGKGPRQLVLLGHMDTVGGEVPVRYETGADGVRRLYGRGSVDAKGPLCTFILAAEAAREQILESGWQVIVIGAVEEEAASSKGARHVAKAYRPDMCIIGEPSSSDAVTLGYKGRVIIEGRVEQTVQHTAIPGPNASERAVAVWNWVKQFAEFYNEGKKKAYDQLMPSLRNISTGSDGLHEWCDIYMSVRLPPDYTPQQLEKALQSHIQSIRSEEKDESEVEANTAYGMKISFRGRELAYRGRRDSTLVYAFLDSIRAHSLRPRLLDKTGTSDMNVVGPVWNVPIVAYGPGDSKLDHTPIEHMPEPEFARAVSVLTQAIRNIIAA
jgi:[amino group carrier protein]-lysine/ornithine hydrolase